MTVKYRIPITAITVFGTSSLLALTVGIVLYLGFSQAAESTRKLWADQAKTLIDAMEQSLHAHLSPVTEQAKWVAGDIKDVSDLGAMDDYFFGVLAATPMVAGVAIIRPDGSSRRWHRQHRVAIDEDWSQRPWLREYLQLVKDAAIPGWREPIFTDTVDTTTLLHDIPLYDERGDFIGVFAQIVPVQEFSYYIAREYSDTGITPFILYDRNFVLAHPALTLGDEQQPLKRLENLGDLVLQRIWSPDEDVAYIQVNLENTRASGVFWDNDFFLFIYRDLTRYGQAPWTIGAYINTTLLSDKPGQRIMRALAVGLAVLVLALIASVIVGRKVSSPVKAIVQAADAVNSGELDTVKPLAGSQIRELDEASRAFNDMVSGLRERKLIRDTLGRFVPQEIASSLLAGGGKLDVQQSEASILFCDIEAFTRLTETLGPVKIVEVLNAYFSRMVEILERHGGVVTQFQGDAILATFNVPVADHEHARNAVLAAQDMLTAVAGSEYAGERLNIRIGINTGPVIAGAIGARGRLNYTVHGDAVNLAARLEALNKEYGTRLLLSQSVIAEMPDSRFELVGETSVRGQTGTLELYTPATPIGGK